jgi:hypothetical protein
MIFTGHLNHKPINHIVRKVFMSKTEYYQSSSELEMAIVKLKSMDEVSASMLYGNIENDTPPNKLLSAKQRDKTFKEVSLTALEYLWIGCTKSDMKIRISAKAAYLARCTEDNHPRKKLLFTYRENMFVVNTDEQVMIKERYGMNTSKPTVRREIEYCEICHDEISDIGCNCGKY